MVDMVPFAASETPIDGLWRIQMKQVTDERGTVREFYRESAFVEAGLAGLGPWVQINVTESHQGVVRGLHGENTTKLVTVAAGAALGAYVDLRPGSATYRQVHLVELVPGVQLLVPAGVANGFQAVSAEPTQYCYGFDAEWVPAMVGTHANPLDPALAIPWPLAVDPTDPAQLSAKDAGLPHLDR